MTVKLAILKSGESIISNIKELISEEKVVGYLFENPCVVGYDDSIYLCLLYTSPSPRDVEESRMPSSA